MKKWLLELEPMSLFLRDIKREARRGNYTHAGVGFCAYLLAWIVAILVSPIVVPMYLLGRIIAWWQQ